MIQGVRTLPYKDKRKHLNYTLERRRLRDLIKIYKLIKGLSIGDVTRVLVVKEPSRTHRNGYKIDEFRLN